MLYYFFFFSFKITLFFVGFEKAMCDVNPHICLPSCLSLAASLVPLCLSFFHSLCSLLTTSWIPSKLVREFGRCFRHSFNFSAKLPTILADIFKLPIHLCISRRKLNEFSTEFRARRTFFCLHFQIWQISRANSVHPDGWKSFGI